MVEVDEVIVEEANFGVVGGGGVVFGVYGGGVIVDTSGGFDNFGDLGGAVFGVVGGVVIVELLASLTTSAAKMASL
ncbi:hypothetical protein AGMMS49950_11480 [Endomicrobiia bacterium]|nr:hypothetical protein AGMMS49950_11480 [Endomicrobiia bacterium]